MPALQEKSERKEAFIPGDDWASQEHSTFTEVTALSSSSYPGHARARSCQVLHLLYFYDALKLIAIIIISASISCYH